MKLLSVKNFGRKSMRNDWQQELSNHQRSEKTERIF